MEKNKIDHLNLLKEVGHFGWSLKELKETLYIKHTREPKNAHYFVFQQRPFPQQLLILIFPFLFISSLLFPSPHIQSHFIFEYSSDLSPAD